MDEYSFLIQMESNTVGVIQKNVNSSSLQLIQGATKLKTCILCFILFLNYLVQMIESKHNWTQEQVHLFLTGGLV